MLEKLLWHHFETISISPESLTSVKVSKHVPVDNNVLSSWVKGHSEVIDSNLELEEVTVVTQCDSGSSTHLVWRLERSVGIQRVACVDGLKKHLFVFRSVATCFGTASGYIASFC